MIHKPDEFGTVHKITDHVHFYAKMQIKALAHITGTLLELPRFITQSLYILNIQNPEQGTCKGYSITVF